MLYRDALIQVVRQLDDIIDWINFMLTSTRNYHFVYPEFIRTKFYFMTINFITLPPCTPVNDRRFIKIFEHEPSRKGIMYVTTDKTFINLHSRISWSGVYEIYGLFSHGLKFDHYYGVPYINYEQLYDLFTRNYDNDLTTEESITICQYPHIKEIDAYQSLEMTLNYVRNNYKSHIEENEKMIYKSFYNIIMSDYFQQIYCWRPFMLQGHMTCVFCNETINDDIELSNTKKHQYIHDDSYGDNYHNLVVPIDRSKKLYKM